MGVDNSKVLNTNVMYQTVKNLRSKFSEKDEELFTFAVEKIVSEKESLENVELFLAFVNIDPITVRAKCVKETSDRIYVRFVNGTPTYSWESKSLGRKARQYFVDRMGNLIKYLRENADIIGGGIGFLVGNATSAAIGYAVGTAVGRALGNDAPKKAIGYNNDKKRIM